MDPRLYSGPRGQGQQGQGGHQSDDFFSPRGKQDDSYNQKGKQAEVPLGQRPRQEDAFGQRPKQDDQFVKRGKQEDLFANENLKTETSLKVHDDSYGAPKRPPPGDPQRRQSDGGSGRRDTFGEYASGGTDIENSHFQPNQYSSVVGDAELHGAPGTDVMQNPAMQTMVKMVTMLNFMKVELGETKTLRSKEQWRAAAAEFIGTMLFVFIGCGSVVASGMLYSDMTPSRLVAIAIAHGLAITCLAGATGAISGGHLNPAVTLAFVVAGKENLVRAGLYVAAQLLGAIFGAIFLKIATPEELRGTLGSHDVNELIYTTQAFVMETVLTFLLVIVIFGVAVDRRGPGVIAPIPIGFAVTVDHLVGVPYTGASMNPARSFGPALVSGNFGSAHLMYWVAPAFGATAAAALYRYGILEPAEATARAAAATPKK